MEVLIVLDRALKVLTHDSDESIKESSPQSIPLMRANYSGEVAAQGLYLGAGLFERNQYLISFYDHAMQEEFKHLDWCGKRISELGGKVSVFNPVWFMGAFLMGSCSQVLGSEYALGFVHETEEQVLSHLRSHLSRLPKEDVRSYHIVEKMIEEEASHANEALTLGGKPLPRLVKHTMHGFGKVLTTLSEWI